MIRGVAIVIAAALSACSFRIVPTAPSDADPGATDADPDAVDGPVIGDAASDWWNPMWTRRRKITIKHTELIGPVQSFPLLVRLPAGVSTADLRFLATDQTTILPHEIDTAPAGAVGAVVWVRIPDLPNSGDPPVLWVYYGNAAATSTSNGPAVFGDYVSVHHLGTSLADASGHNHTASAAGNERPVVAPGLIGEARDFDGNDDHLDLAGETAFDFTTQLGVSAWVRRQELGAVPYMAIVTKGDKTWRLHREDVTQFAGFGTTTSDANDNLQGTRSIDDGNWHHLAITLLGDRKRLYVDGQQDAMRMGITTPIDTNNLEVSFGYNADANVGGTRNWNGDIDEVRISTTAFDANRIFADHHTVTDIDFVQIGPEESSPP